MSLPSASATRAWVALVRAQAAAMARVERALKAEGFPPLEWYDVLLELERAGPSRPRDLERRLLLAQYNLSRLLDRMEAAGVVARAPCASDGRGRMVEIAEAGLALRARMWPPYAAAIRAAIADHLSDDEAAALADLLERLG